MASIVKYPDEMKERAVRLVNEALESEPELGRTEAIKRIGARLGIPYGTLRTWVYNSAPVEGKIAKVAPTPEAKRIKELEREVKELKRANEILLAASSFFARELDPRLPF